MNLTLRFADSEVTAVTSSSEGVCIRMSAAYVLRSEEPAGSKPTEGFARAVLLILAGARLDELPGHYIGRISHGRVEIGSQWASVIALPSSTVGKVKLELGFANQSHLLVEASGIECRFEGEPNFAESLFC